MLADLPFGGVFGRDGLYADVLDAGDVVDAAAAVVGEADDPLVEPEPADGLAAPLVAQDQVVGALLAALEARLDPALGAFGLLGALGALLA
ncbi:hypothetical protein [Streptomyces sp. NPDC015345]|uniref:hypothetical protein n=1 Tax=Streptomyces sp. NPDC015345 TaxID=3364953 RepID=UPI0036F4D647